MGDNFIKLAELSIVSHRH